MDIENNDKNVVAIIHGNKDIAAAAAVLSEILTTQEVKNTAVASKKINTSSSIVSSNYENDNAGVSISTGVICISLCLGLCFLIYNAGIVHSMLNL